MVSSRNVRNERGTVQYALLALLSPRPRHGYDLRETFESALGGHWPLNSGQIYSSLERLKRDSLVVEAGTDRGAGPEKRLWSLTEEGRNEVAAWFATSVQRDYRLRDELYLKLMLAVVTEATRPDLILQRQRLELFRELHRLTSRRNLSDPHSQLAQILLYDSAIMHTEAELRWLDLVEARLGDVRSQPVLTRSRRSRTHVQPESGVTGEETLPDQHPPPARGSERSLAVQFAIRESVDFDDQQ